MIAFLKRLYANWKLERQLYKKLLHYRAIVDHIENLIEHQELNHGEKIWSTIHRDYFHRKWIETSLAIDRIKWFKQKDWLSQP